MAKTARLPKSNYKTDDIRAAKVALKERHDEERRLRQRVRHQQEEWNAERALVAELVIARCKNAKTYAEAHPQYAELDAFEVRKAVNLGVVTIPNLSRLEIIERDGGNCEICGKKIDLTVAYPSRDALHVEHIVALEKGGPHVPDNLRLVHIVCSGRIRIKSALEASKNRALASV